MPPFDVRASAVTFKIGDLVKVVKIPSDLNDAAGIGTPGVFREALGRRLRIMGFDQYGFVELKVTKSDTIWIEPEFLLLVERRRRAKK